MIRRKIRNELLKIGYNPIHIGTNYLVEGILILYISEKKEVGLNLEKDIYLELSKKYNKSANAIKASIRKATDYADLYSATREKIEMFETMKLTPKVVTIILLDKLNSETIPSINS
ncbi:MAG: hypothetical protein HFJ28_07010 [Clostridia bacterium]|jgi:hypothetical protein|nr:hypothetical protein [Clostridia bacterium]